MKRTRRAVRLGAPVRAAVLALVGLVTTTTAARAAPEPPGPSAPSRAALTARFQELLGAHAYAGSVRGPLAFSPDGKTLAALLNGWVATFDARSGRLVRRFDFPNAQALGFSADGRRLLALMDDAFAAFDVRSGGRTSGPAREFATELSSAAFSRDGRRAILTLPAPGEPEDVPLALIDTTRLARRDLAAPGERLVAAHFTADERRVVAVSARGAVLEFDVATARLVGQRTPTAALAVRAGVMAAGGRWAALLASDGAALSYDTAIPAVVATLAPPPGDGFAELLPAADGKTLYASTDQGVLLRQVGAVTTPDVIRAPSPGKPAGIHMHVALAPGDARLAVVTRSGELAIHDLARGAPVPLAGHTPFARPDDAAELLWLARELGQPLPASLARLAARQSGEPDANLRKKTAPARTRAPAETTPTPPVTRP